MQFNNGAGPSILTGTVDPTSVATSANAGSLYQNTSNSNIYKKNDNGSTTNWLNITGNSVTMTDWVSWTPVITGLGTVSGVQFQSRRIGDSLEIQGKAISGTPTAVETRFSIGFNGVDANVTSDTTKIPSIMKCGDGAFDVAGASDLAMLIEPTVQYLTIGSQTASSAGLAKLNGNVLMSAGNTLSFYARVPIAGWTALSGGGAGITRSINSISSPTSAGSAVSTDYVYFVSGATTLTLPTAVSNTNRYTVKNTGVATVTIATTSAQTIDGSASASLPVANTTLDLISDGSNWRVA